MPWHRLHMWSGSTIESSRVCSTALDTTADFAQTPKRPCIASSLRLVQSESQYSKPMVAQVQLWRGQLLRDW